MNHPRIEYCSCRGEACVEGLNVINDPKCKVLNVIKTESSWKLSNFNSQWTKTLYQNTRLFQGIETNGHNVARQVDRKCCPYYLYQEKRPEFENKRYCSVLLFLIVSYLLRAKTINVKQ